MNWFAVYKAPNGLLAAIPIRYAMDTATVASHTRACWFATQARNKGHAIEIAVSHLFRG